MFVGCDLATLAEVRACADALTARAEPFDVVIANAGVRNCPFGLTADGFETHFGTNHLAHFVLVNRIAPLLRGGGRVVTLTSLAHHTADIDLDRSRRGRGVRATAVQPGGIRTPLLRHTTPEVVQDMLAQVAAHSQGPAQPVKTAVDPARALWTMSEDLVGERFR